VTDFYTCERSHLNYQGKRSVMDRVPASKPTCACRPEQNRFREPTGVKQAFKEN
jgi:hypothetical protein